MRPLITLLAGVLLLGAGTGAVKAADTVPTHTDENGSVLGAADRLANAVRKRDVKSFLELVAPDGVPCIDSKVSRTEKQLRTRDTWLGAYFFAPDVFRARYADLARPISFAEFLATAQDLHVTAATRDQRYPCVRFSARNIKWKPHFCFERKSGHWFLRELPNCG